MKIVVVGIGYVGFAISILLAQKNRVVAIDVSKKKINFVNKKKNLFSEKLITDFLKNKILNLRATENLAEYRNADAVIICVPTNYDFRHKMLNTSIVDTTISDILRFNKKCSIFIKSTVPIGFTQQMIKKYNYDNIYFLPEFLREGNALFDCLNPSRIIIGVPYKDIEHINTAKQFINLLSQCQENKDVPAFIMGTSEAESTKLFSNAYLAMRVSYFNELDTFAEINKLNAKDIIDGVCSDPRIGNFYNNPSFGYGGYCLPKDVRQLQIQMSNANICCQAAKYSTTSNINRKKYIVKNICRLCDEIISEKGSAFLGFYRLISKTGTDNFRKSIICDLIKALSKRKNISIIIFEPLIKHKIYLGCKVENNLELFKKKCNLIIANRIDNNLSDVLSKIYTRDLFQIN